MLSADTSRQRHELAAFLRAHRERLTPAMVGLPGGERRRTPGLRREEVAMLCGVSATWYTWIEQGRDVSVSPPALARLADALRLSAAERGYLFDLAGKRDPVTPGESAVPALERTVTQVLAHIQTPAYLLNRDWSALAWTPQAEHLFVGWLTTGPDRNLLRYTFLSGEARALLHDWRERARRITAEFRADYSRRPDAPDLQMVIADLTEKSPLFARYWEDQTVLAREGGERRFRHPQDGPLCFHQTTFTLAGHAEIKLVILTPA